MSKPKPNCEVKTREDTPWEPRYADESGQVYAYHRGKLWPQWHKEQYYNFRWLVTLDKEHQVFYDYKDIMK